MVPVSCKDMRLQGSQAFRGEETNSQGNEQRTRLGTSVCLATQVRLLNKTASVWQQLSSWYGPPSEMILGSYGGGKTLCLCLLGLGHLQLEIIHVLKRCILGWHILLPPRQHPWCAQNKRSFQKMTHLQNPTRWVCTHSVGTFYCCQVSMAARPKFKNVLICFYYLQWSNMLLESDFNICKNEHPQRSISPNW